ncbi:MAG: NADH-quinone oxidoreductase subunit I [Elusimicrobia bacterium ADurb.Bin231]|nr:MAG: NADH-quinone oxidoreductase subunit I [Elusimicrobia bacterium ADurb.Bin231]
MPRGDGTGPLGQGAGTGRGMGGCGKGAARGGGRGMNAGRGAGRGMNTGRGVGISRGGNIQYRSIPSRRASSISGRKAVVEIEKCTACGICADVCPQQAITIDNVANINLSKCTGCGACVAACPNGAISLQ